MKNLFKKILAYIMCMIFIFAYTIYSYQPKVEAKELGYIAISTKTWHTAALRDDGTVWCWGDNSLGQLGDGTYTNSTTPVQAKSLNGIKAISAGEQHTIALKDDGTVWCWGDNSLGQLGNATLISDTSSDIPLKVNGLNRITAISASGFNSTALKDDGTVWCWGDNYYGQLGDGTSNSSTTPVQVKDLSSVTAISTGWSYTVALKNDGTVWCWGDNYSEQSPTGTPINTTTPVQIKDLSEITAISTGNYHTAALKSDGSVWCWGYNNYGQLGNGTIDDNTTPPAEVKNLSGITAISTGDSYTVALKNDGTVWCWGNNESGQLGNGTTTNSTVPIQVAGLSGITAISGGNSHISVLKDDGTIWSWGANDYGQLGDSTDTAKTTPVSVNNGDGFVALDKTSLDIGYTSGDSKTNITQNIKLPTIGANRSTIAWSSSNPSVISSTGIVTRPNFDSGNTTITLTATITKGLATDTKTFDLTVIRQPLSATEAIALDKNSLQIGYALENNSSKVTQNLVLPTTGTNRTIITWSSSDSSIISNTGIVNRPSFTSGDKAITLTATITKGNVTATKTFDVTVIKNPVTDAELITLDKASLEIGYATGDSSNNVIKNLLLPTTGDNETTITWSSSNAYVLSNAGIVNRPSFESGDARITLIATITKGTVTDTKTFELTVVKNPALIVDPKPSDPENPSNSKEIPPAKEAEPEILPATGTPLDFSALTFIGLFVLFTGSIIMRKKKEN